MTLFRTRGVHAHKSRSAPALVRARNAYIPAFHDAILASAEAHHQFGRCGFGACRASRDEGFVFLGLLTRLGDVFVARADEVRNIFLCRILPRLGVAYFALEERGFRHHWLVSDQVTLSRI
jgi:hypothetical protein